MKDEIKEILQLIGNCYYYGKISEEQKRKYFNYITNLQEENNYYFKKNNELSTLNTSLRNDRDDYKSRNEKAIEYCNKEIGNIIAYFDYADTKDLENVIKILQGEDNTTENLYKYTPEKGFRLVGDDNER